MVWMKIALDGTHLYAERQEYCHYVAAIAFRQIGFRRPFSYSGPAAPQRATACSFLCHAPPIQWQSITCIHSKAMMLLLNHQRFQIAHWCQELVFSFIGWFGWMFACVRRCHRARAVSYWGCYLLSRCGSFETVNNIWNKHLAIGQKHLFFFLNNLFGATIYLLLYVCIFSVDRWQCALLNHEESTAGKICRWLLPFIGVKDSRHLACVMYFHEEHLTKYHPAILLREWCDSPPAGRWRGDELCDFPSLLQTLTVSTVSNKALKLNMDTFHKTYMKYVL